MYKYIYIKSIFCADRPVILLARWEPRGLAPLVRRPFSLLMEPGMDPKWKNGADRASVRRTNLIPSGGRSTPSPAFPRRTKRKRSWRMMGFVRGRTALDEAGAASSPDADLRPATKRRRPERTKPAERTNPLRNHSAPRSENPPRGQNHFRAPKAHFPKGTCLLGVAEPDFFLACGRGLIKGIISAALIF